MKRKTIIFLSLMILSAACFFAPSTSAGTELDQNISGKYLRETEEERAELEIKVLPYRRVHVTGISDWGTTQGYGPNIGELDFVAELRNGRIIYSEKIGKGQYYKLKLTPKKNSLSAKEQGGPAKFGMNVTFAGEYKKKVTERGHR